MTPLRAERFILLCEFALDMMERQDIPADARERAAQILGLQEKATRYVPPVVVVDADVLEPMAERE
jgi:hypothetical protein